MPGTEELFIVIISHGTGHGAPCGCLQLVGHILKGVAFGECGASSATFKTFEFIQNSYVYYLYYVYTYVYTYIHKSVALPAPHKDLEECGASE